MPLMSLVSLTFARTSGETSSSAVHSFPFLLPTDWRHRDTSETHSHSLRTKIQDSTLFSALFEHYIPCHSWAGPWQWSSPQWTSLAKQTDLGPAWRCGPGTRGEWWAARGRLRSDYVTEAAGEGKKTALVHMSKEMARKENIQGGKIVDKKMKNKLGTSPLPQKSVPAALPCC